MSSTEEKLFEPEHTIKLAFYHVVVAVCRGCFMSILEVYKINTMTGGDF